MKKKRITKNDEKILEICVNINNIESKMCDMNVELSEHPVMLFPEFDITLFFAGTVYALFIIHLYFHSHAQLRIYTANISSTHTASSMRFV